MSESAIVLHSSWRAASTYLWAKFRERSDTCCYFEPLNEHLAVIKPEEIDLFRPWSFAHHPPLDAPYLEEFRPLIEKTGGFSGFPLHLAYGHYCTSDDDELPELAAYFRRLAAYADGRGRRPVYGLVRSALRVRWFRAHIPGTHLFIRRAPRCQFLSMLNQAAKGNPYFLQRPLVILQQNPNEKLFEPIRMHIGAEALSAMIAAGEALAGPALQRAPLEPIYKIFFFLHRLAEEYGERQCDLVVDIDRVSVDPDMRGEIEARIAGLTGIALSFADCTVERYERQLRWSDGHFAKLEEQVDALPKAHY